ncbi:unnamed protein product [Chondrus crispus]|uniref:Uncharacterized protein n=1 Tax=Chondrus crispus TaxID=2769 RepID=R7QI46_CHOCR|nr:unnamed protein product [Chondrus crispus]CDF37141.1 unnamed protein product [Chondrus crispus]|eukprot:XP_005716960.1 unnamed protein product [Chondrus crispus]
MLALKRKGSQPRCFNQPLPLLLSLQRHDRLIESVFHGLSNKREKRCQSRTSMNSRAPGFQPKSSPQKIPSWQNETSPTAVNDPAVRLNELRLLLAKKDSELNELRTKAIEFQTRLDRVSKLLPRKDNN